MNGAPLIQIPPRLSANAWTGAAAASGPVHPQWDRWARSQTVTPMDSDLLATPADPRSWWHEDVGWGLILTDDPGLDDEAKATPADAPQPIIDLWEARGAGPVLRYASGRDQAFLRRYYPHRPPQDIAIAGGAPPGTGVGALPMYLLIAASPDEIPWRLQYRLNGGRAVGRLDLAGEALRRYVDAAIAGWPDSDMRIDATTIWAVDHGSDDITRLLRLAIAEKLHAMLDDDADLSKGATLLTDDAATHAGLRDRLVADHPGLIVTTSHGMTGPLDDPEAMATTLGLPVDTRHAVVDPEELIAEWQPDGAIWFAEACCSAGSDSVSIYADLFAPESELSLLLDGIATTGSRTAPLPTALLGCERPARAFIGHVEPTFDWTLRQPKTGQHLADQLATALYEGLYQESPLPVGLAMRPWFDPIGGLAIAHTHEVENHVLNDAPLDYASWYQLAIGDRSSLVILGDPAVALPSLVAP